jgi:hypothetical protein
MHCCYIVKPVSFSVLYSGYNIPRYQRSIIVYVPGRNHQSKIMRTASRPINGARKSECAPTRENSPSGRFPGWSMVGLGDLQAKSFRGETNKYIEESKSRTKYEGSHCSRNEPSCSRKAI